MIECTKNDYKEILNYIGNEYAKCAYLYIDLKKYGFKNNNVQVWKQIDSNREINVIALRYYNGMHIYSRTNKFEEVEIANLINKVKPALVCGMKDTLSKIETIVPDYTPEYGKVLKLFEYSGVANNNVRQARKEELREIAALLSTDEEMGGPYGYKLLYKQLLERYEEGFGRYWLRRDEFGIVSHCATYAELDNIAVISGGIVRQDYRGKGEYPGQLGAMCRELYKEGKEVISYYYGGAKTAHKLVGFRILGDWEKLILNNEVNSIE